MENKIATKDHKELKGRKAFGAFCAVLSNLSVNYSNFTGLGGKYEIS